MAPFALTKFFVYETVARVYIVGTDNHQQRFRLLKIDRSGAPEDFTSSSDGMEYDAVEFQALLQALHDGNPDGGCQLVAEAFGVVGTPRIPPPPHPSHTHPAPRKTTPPP